MDGCPGMPRDAPTRLCQPFALVTAARRPLLLLCVPRSCSLAREEGNRGANPVRQPGLSGTDPPGIFPSGSALLLRPVSGGRPSGAAASSPRGQIARSQPEDG